MAERFLDILGGATLVEAKVVLAEVVKYKGNPNTSEMCRLEGPATWTAEIPEVIGAVAY